MSYGWTPEDDKLVVGLAGALQISVALLMAHSCAPKQAKRPLTPPESLYASGGETR